MLFPVLSDDCWKALSPVDAEEGPLLLLTSPWRLQLRRRERLANSDGWHFQNTFCGRCPFILCEVHLVSIFRFLSRLWVRTSPVVVLTRAGVSLRPPSVHGTVLTAGVNTWRAPAVLSCTFSSVVTCSFVFRWLVQVTHRS